MSRKSGAVVPEPVPNRESGAWWGTAALLLLADGREGEEEAGWGLGGTVAKLWGMGKEDQSRRGI